MKVPFWCVSFQNFVGSSHVNQQTVPYTHKWIFFFVHRLMCIYCCRVTRRSTTTTDDTQLPQQPKKKTNVRTILSFIFFSCVLWVCFQLNFTWSTLRAPWLDIIVNVAAGVVVVALFSLCFIRMMIIAIWYCFRAGRIYLFRAVGSLVNVCTRRARSTFVSLERFSFDL